MTRTAAAFLALSGASLVGGVALLSVPMAFIVGALVLALAGLANVDMGERK